MQAFSFWSSPPYWLEQSRWGGGGEKRKKTPARKGCENEKRFTDLPEMTNRPIKMNRKLHYISDKNKHTRRIHMLPPNIGENRTCQLCSAEMSETNPNDNCRLCKVSFKVKFGNLGKQSHSSPENLFKPSKRQDCFGVRLSEIGSQVGLKA